jgi:hypothetical protein
MDLVCLRCGEVYWGLTDDELRTAGQVGCAACCGGELVEIGENFDRAVLEEVMGNLISLQIRVLNAGDGDLATELQQIRHKLGRLFIC